MFVGDLNGINKPQADITQTPAFKAWFGKSKVVDENGRPLKVYHGTAADFSAFKLRPGDVGIHFGTVDQADDRAAYKASKQGQDDAPNRMIPVYLSIRNPLRTRDLGAWRGENLFYELKDHPQFKGKVFDNMNAAQIRKVIEAAGYDGIVYKNTGEVAGGIEYYRAMDKAGKAMVAAQKTRGKPVNTYDKEDQETPEYKAHQAAEIAYRTHRETNGVDSYIAFSPKQIKSAVGNKGTFNPKSSELTESFKWGTSGGRFITPKHKTKKKPKSYEIYKSIPTDPPQAIVGETTPLHRHKKQISEHKKISSNYFHDQVVKKVGEAEDQPERPERKPEVMKPGPNSSLREQTPPKLSTPVSKMKITRASYKDVMASGLFNAGDVLKIEKPKWISIDNVIETQHNNRKPEGQAKAWSIANSIRDEETIPALWVDAKDQSLLDGHHRLEAMRKMGWKLIPVQYLHLRDL